MADPCVSCASPIPDGARFCMSCGQPVPPSLAVAAASEVRHAALAATAPRSLVEKLRAPRLTGERKPVTALFADVVGSTSLAESMDPEEWTQILNGAFEVMSRAIHRYEGTIAKLLGDAILAFFGAPVTHEDDPQRAVRAALDLIVGIREYAEPLRESGIDLQVRIGINTGPVVVGNVGSDLRYEYTAMGDAVNVAARMQTAAAPGAILVTDAIYRFVAPLVDAVDLGPIDVKGKSEPVRAYEITGLKATAGPLRGLAGLESPMVGRQAQLEALVGALDAVAAGSGGRVAVIVGEPGIGKSRLLAELRRASLELPRPAGWIEGRCLSYGQQLPYHLLGDILRSLIGTTQAAEEPELRAALGRELPAVLGDGGDVAEATAFLAHLLGIGLSPAEEAVVALDPITLQAGYLKSLRAVLAARMRREPMVLVCEDIHWADPSSTEPLIRLFPFVRSSPMLLVFASRPDRDTAGWRLVSQARETFGDALIEITLAPLTEDQSRELVANLLMIESLPARVRDFILARAEGNPFFVEEVVRMLIDRGAIERRGENWVATAAIEGVEIPDTLQGLLLARIDRLPEDARRTLRVASVIGRQFSARVLEEVLAEAGAN